MENIHILVKKRTSDSGYLFDNIEAFQNKELGNQKVEYLNKKSENHVISDFKRYGKSEDEARKSRKMRYRNTYYLEEIKLVK